MSSLYIDHFGLRKPPFQITPDLDFFFTGGRRGDILTALLHVATHDEGIITLVAEVGSGKTLLARLMIMRLDPQVFAIYLANPCFSRDEIIAAIARDLGLTDLATNIEGKLAALQQELLRRHAQGQRVVLVIDEAHAMPVESLEEVRLLSNLETGQHKLINIMLFGQPELDALLAEPRLRQVRDRVIHRFELRALQAVEANAYIDHRLRAAGWQGAGLFSASAMTRLVKASGGRARRINLLADKALLAAYAQGSLTVELPHVDSAVQELPNGAMHSLDKANRHPWSKPGLGWVLAGCIATAALGLLAWYLKGLPSDRVDPSKSLALGSPPPELPPVLTAKRVAGPEPVRNSNPAAQLSPGDEKPAMRRAAPPTGSRAQEVLDRTQARLKETPLSGYTVQLGAFETVGVLDPYLTRMGVLLDPSQMYAQFSDYKGKTYMAVYFGNFGSASDAALALQSWPPSVRENRPLVRSWAKVKQEQTP